MWGVARTFVLAHAGMKIQTYGADFLETFNSPDMSVAARVNMVPLPGGARRIEAAFWCGNMFGCYEGPRALLDQFNRTVSAASQ